MSIRTVRIAGVWCGAALLLALGACASGDEPEPTTPGTEDPSGENNADDENNDDTSEQELRPAFTLGQSWIVGSIYRSTAVKTPEELAAPIEGVNADLIDVQSLMPAEVVPGDSTAWTSPIFWEFGVINTGYVPEDGPFADLARDAEGNVQPITIIKAVAPKELNSRSVVEGMDPVFYLVLRESDWRVKAVHYNYKVRSSRNTVVIELPAGEAGGVELGADSDWFLVDYLMPVFPLPVMDGAMAYGPEGGGASMDVSVAGPGVAQVRFVSGVDGSPVRQQWSAEQPWFDWSITASRRSWRLTPGQVEALLDLYGVEVVTNSQFLEPAQAINSKFRNRINLTTTFTVAPGRVEAHTPATHTPWAGYWYPLRDAGTLFGWSGGPNGRRLVTSGPATSLRAQLDTELGELDAAMDEIIALKADAPERTEKINTYWERRKTAATTIRRHFEDPAEGVLAKLRDGRMALADIDHFGPLEKWALYLLATKQSDRPFEAAIWEFTRQYNPRGGSWWGKCNGWSAAAILSSEPNEPVTIPLDLSHVVQGQTAPVNMTFQTGDLKALAASSYYGTHSHFYGQRYYGPDDDRGANYQDIQADVFHRLIAFYIGEEKFPMVFELTPNEQIWNYPCYAYTADIGQRETLDAGTRGVNVAPKADLTNAGVSAAGADAMIARRQGPKGTYATWEEVQSTPGVTSDDVTKLQQGGFSLWGERLAHRVTTDLKCATDGVSAWHVDTAGADPAGFTKHYTYNLVVNDAGRMLRGEWTGGSIEDHPDFVWVPYANEERRSTTQEWRQYGTWERYAEYIYWSRYAPSENPFLFTDLLSGLLDIRENAPQVCNADPDDCGPGLRCNPVDGACMPASVEPDPEPTAGCIGAERAEGLTPLTGNAAQGKVCAGRDSWFGLALAEGDKVEISVTFAHSAGDIDVELYDPAGKKVRSSAGTSDLESVLWTAAAAGTYRLRVFGYSGAENEVQVRVAVTTTTSTPSCAEEAGEPNNGAASATPLTAGERAGAICGNDADWYRVDATGAWTVTLSFTHSRGDLDMKATKPDGTALGTSQGTGDTERLSGTGPALIQVYGYGGAVNAYRINLQ